MSGCCRTHTVNYVWLQTRIGAYLTTQLLPDFYDIHLNDRNVVTLFGKIHNILLKLTGFNLQSIHTCKQEIVPLRENILKLIEQIRLAVSPNKSTFALILEKALESVAILEVDGLCDLHFTHMSSYIKKHLVEPVKMFEKSLLQQLCHSIHEPPSIDILKELITVCPTLDINLLTNEDRQSVLHAICTVSKDDLDLILVCLKGVPSESLLEFINLKRMDDGNTALHLASKNGSRNIVQYLMEQGAQTSITNSLGQTALEMAANDDIFIIIEQADLFDSSTSPIHLFTTLLKKSKLLEDKLQNLKTLKNDAVLLNYAIDCGSATTVEEILERNKSCANGRNVFGVPLIVKAIGLGNVDIIQNLLKKGADASARYHGMNALHFAVKKGDVRVVDVLLNYVDDVNVKIQGSGHTALHLAAGNGHVAIVNLLLSYGANFELENNSADTPKKVSINRDVCDLLQEVADLHDIIEKNDFRRKDYLIDLFCRAERSNHIDVLFKATNKNGKTAAQLIMEKKGLVYSLLKNLFLCSSKPPDGS